MIEKKQTNQLSDEFIEKLARSLEEEEVDLYVLRMHYLNDADLVFFNEKDQSKIKKILRFISDKIIHR